MNLDIAEKLMMDLIPSSGHESFDKVALNVNSFLSVMSYKTVLEEIENERMVEVTISEIFKLLQTMITDRFPDKEIYLFMRDIREPSVIDELLGYSLRGTDSKNFNHKVFKWYFMKVVKVLRKLADYKSVTLVTTVTGETHFLMRNTIIENPKSQFLILSRDPLDLLYAIQSNVAIWNGTHYYSGMCLRPYKKSSSLYTFVPPDALPMVFLLCGINKYNYRGIEKLNVKSLTNMINKYGLYSPEIEALIKKQEKYKPAFYAFDYYYYLTQINKKEKL